MKHTLTRRSVLGAGAVVAGATALAACGEKEEAPKTADGKIEVTFSGWNLKSTPEFNALADAFNKSQSDVVVKVTEYDASKYDDQLTADLAAKKGPDVISIKNLSKIFTYIDGGVLADVTDAAKPYVDDKNIDLSILNFSEKYYALPFRMDHYLMYYNKEMFKKAGVAEPTGEWTWEDWAKVAQELTDKLGQPQVIKGAFVMAWPGPVQGFALAQTPGADDLSGDLQYLKPYYDRALALQAAGATQDYSTIKGQKLHYRSEFGTQKAAMTPMGTWFMGMMVNNVKSGEAQKFDWAVAPVPQATAADYAKPKTFGNPTAAGVNAQLKGEKLEAAKKFLAYMASEEAGLALAGVGISPAYKSDKVVEKLFSLEGMPKDELSKKAYHNADIHPETSIAKQSPKVSTIMTQTHDAIMTKSTSVEDGLKSAQDQLVKDGLTDK